MAFVPALMIIINSRGIRRRGKWKVKKKRSGGGEKLLRTIDHDTEPWMDRGGGGGGGEKGFR